MFEAYSTIETIFVENQPITFENIRFDDCRVRVTNSNTFTICAPGRYYVYFGSTGQTGAAGTPFSVQLFNNGVAVPAVDSQTEVATPHDLSFSTIINVRPSNCMIDNVARLQVVVTSEQDGTLFDRNIIIFRLK